LITLSSSSAPDDAERTEVYYGAENVIDEELRFFLKTKRRIDTCMSPTRPSLAVGMESIKKSFVNAKNRGVKLRYLTEITKDNIDHCRELMEIVDEFRHLEGIKSNFMLSESEYLAPVVFNGEGKIASEIIYSSIRSFVDQQQYFFDMLWNKAIPAKRKIREIEEGIEPTRTRIIEDKQEIIKEIKRKNNAANKLSICTSVDGMQMSYNHLFDSYKNVVNKYKKGESIEGMRWLLNLDNQESIGLVRIFLETGIQVRHIKSMPPLSFGVTEKEVAITIEKMVGGKMSESFLISNEPVYVNHFNSLFDELWSNGIDAKDKIREIEEGVKHPIIEVIEDTQKSIARAFDIINLAKNEISAMFASANTFLLAVEINALDYYQKALQRGVKVNVLIPSNVTGNDHSYNNSLNSSKNRTNNDIVTKVNEIRKKLPQLDIRIADKSLQTRITILVVDNSECMIWELKDETKQDPYEAGGIATYSNINSIASSYALIFHALWKQTEILEQSKVNDKIQKDFISIAAHELRTPIQPILGLSDILLSKKGDIEQHKVMLEVIKRNARRLKGLTEDILDVAKIESGSFLLKKERINLNKIIPGIIAEYGSQIKKINNVDMVFISKDDIFVKADKARLSQVFGNVLNNAIKFTTEGKITIKVSKMKKDRNEEDEVVVSVKDTGTGIEPVISSILFTKFATKSDQGTGLGLYISKNIIEAHCGRIWAENNADGRGATFYFSLPMDRS
jgi:two-component system, OmpR family, sensor histidine kinase VicK